MSTYEFLLRKFGPALSVDETARILKRSRNGLKKSANTPGNPLSLAKIRVGRRIYFSTQKLAELLEPAE